MNIQASVLKTSDIIAFFLVSGALFVFSSSLFTKIYENADSSYPTYIIESKAFISSTNAVNAETTLVPPSSKKLAKMALQKQQMEEELTLLVPEEIKSLNDNVQTLKIIKDSVGRKPFSVSQIPPVESIKTNSVHDSTPDTAEKNQAKQAKVAQPHEIVEASDLTKKTVITAPEHLKPEKTADLRRSGKIRFNWTSVPGAFKYHIQAFQKLDDGNSITLIDTEIEETEIKVVPLSNHSFSWSVTAIDVNGNHSEKSSQTDVQILR